MFKAGHDRGMLAVVAVEDNRDNRAAFTGCGVFEDLRRLVPAAVVNQDDFVSLAQLCAGRFGATQEFGQTFFFVVDRNDDRHTLDWVGFQ